MDTKKGWSGGGRKKKEAGVKDNSAVSWGKKKWEGKGKGECKVDEDR